MVQGHPPGTYSESFLDGLGDIGLGQNNCISQLTTVSEVGGDCRRESATGSVDVFRLHPVAGEGLKTRTIREDIDRAFKMASRHHNSACSKLEQFQGSDLHLFQAVYAEAGKGGGLMQVGRDDGYLAQQVVAH